MAARAVRDACFNKRSNGVFMIYLFSPQAGTLSATSGRLPQPSKNQGLDIQIDRHKVANTAAQYKTVPNGVAEANALRGIENHAQRV
ncbi:Uncharacterised protein [Yersinia enterocolitica]|nr:Uncharacterised protein [Yersinia enterocolitica]